MACIADSGTGFSEFTPGEENESRELIVSANSE
jgi:hypothetical protein